MRALGAATFVLGLGLFGCSAAAGPDAGENAGSERAAAADPLAMPAAIISWEGQMGWGSHHLMWHTTRQWDLLDPSDVDWAKKQGWTRAKIQEGAKGNGLEFLAMHRVMIQELTGQFPQNKDLFSGWTVPPTKPGDPTAPKVKTSFDANMLAAIDKLQNHLDQFKSDDDLGLFLETKLRPTSSDPSARSADPMVGIHNYLHNRFMNSKSKIDLGDPSVNLGNKVFWRLHGWIDARWTAFRALKGLKDTDAAYKAALKAAKDGMMDNMPKLGKGPGGPDTTPPDSLTKFFENEDQSSNAAAPEPSSCAHDTCATGDALDATCDSCASAVCAADSYCCSSTWDGTCVSEVGMYCDAPCDSGSSTSSSSSSSSSSGSGGGGDTCAHDECTQGDVLDASCSDCAGIVCGADSYCCATAWDSQCVSEANSSCSNICGG